MDKNIRLYNKKNSIQEVTFVLHLDRIMDESTLKKLISLKEILKDEFQKIEEIKTVTLKIASDQTPIEKIPAPTLAGRQFQRLNNDGKVEWMLKVERNYIVISCLNYEGWRAIWQMAYKYLAIVTKELIGEYFFKAISLQYINCFICDDEKRYRLEEIFDISSPYLTKKVLTAGAIWHVFQGWVDKVSKYSSLNQLNITASEEDKQHLTKIQIFKQAHLDTMYVNEKDKHDSDFLNKALEITIPETMNLLHENIKHIYKDIVSSKVAKNINLKG